MEDNPHHIVLGIDVLPQIGPGPITVDPSKHVVYLGPQANFIVDCSSYLAYLPAATSLHVTHDTKVPPHSAFLVQINLANPISHITNSLRWFNMSSHSAAQETLPLVIPNLR